MRLVIVEDEPPIAEDVEHACRSILGNRIRSLRVFFTLDEAADFLASHPVDLLLLDLTLSGEDGYDLLRQAVAGPFQTIVISAHTDQAIDAYAHGVLDFVPKPLDEERLRLALDRFDTSGLSYRLKSTHSCSSYSYYSAFSFSG